MKGALTLHRSMVKNETLDGREGTDANAPEVAPKASKVEDGIKFGFLKVDNIQHHVKVKKTWSLGTPPKFQNEVKLSTGVSYNLGSKKWIPSVGLHTKIDKLGTLSLTNKCVSLSQKYSYKGKREWTNFDLTFGLVVSYAGKVKPIFDPLPHDVRILATAGTLAFLSGRALGSTPNIPTPLYKTGFETGLGLRKSHPIQLEIREINAVVQL